MKIAVLREITPVRSVQDLVTAAREILSRDTVLSWRFTPQEGPKQADTVVSLHVAGQDHSFLAEFKIRPTADHIEDLAQRASTAAHPPLLIVPRLTERFVELCRKSGVACLDLNGRVWIQRGSVLVDRSPSPDHEPVVALPTEPELFSGKSARVVRSFLSPRRSWTQAELASATGVSRPQLSRVLESLASQGFVRREGSSRGGTWITTQPDGLLDAWARRDIWPRRVTVHQYAILSPTLESAARQLQAAIGSNAVAFTQWFAATHRHSYTDAPVLSAYVRELPGAEALKPLSARPVSDGGRLWLIRPHDDGVFQFTQEAAGFVLVSDAQIYLDLLQVGQRGPDAANALRQWEGFAR